MIYLLDANACIRYLNGRSPGLRQKIDAAQPQDLAICSIVQAEMFFGARKSHTPDKVLAAQQDFFGRFRYLPFDTHAAEIYAELRERLERRGQPIGSFDFMIAAVALAHHATLVTHNVGEFCRISELLLEDWEAELP